MLVATHFDSRKARNLYQQGFLDWETVERAIGDLPDAEGIDIKLGLVPPPMDLHFGRSPTKESLQRYKCIPEGGNRFDLQKADLTLLQTVGSRRSPVEPIYSDVCGGIGLPLP
jgi:hypothetical protein